MPKSDAIASPKSIKSHKMISESFRQSHWRAQGVARLKHSRLIIQAQEAKQLSRNLLDSYEDLNEDLRKQESQMLVKVKAQQKKLDIRRKEVLKQPHEFANYLVSLNLMQSGE